MNNLVISGNTANLVSEIKVLVTNTKQVIHQTVNREMVMLYYEIGRKIVEHEQGGNHRADYGQETLITLAKELSKEFGKGFSKTNLKLIRKFYLKYQKGQTMSDLFEVKLSWSHYCELIKIDDDTKRKFYEKYAIEEGLSVRDFKRQINSLFFERLTLSKDKKSLMVHEREKCIPQSMNETIKDPYFLEFLNLADKHEYHETEIEQAIFDNLQKFILELGQGFSFVARQKRFTIDNDHFYIDMLFYNIHLRSYLVLELKTGKFKHEHAGQMNFYLNYIKNEINQEADNEPFGIILCTDKSHTQVKYALDGIDKNIFPSAYRTALPTEEELLRIVEQSRGYY